MNLNSENALDKDYVVGIGSANLDIYGKSLIDLKPKYDHPSKITTSVGGVTRNVLCNLSLLKVQTKLLAALSDDVFGKIILEDCLKNNIDINNILKIKDESSGVFMQILDNKNDMHMALCDMSINKNIKVNYLKKNENILKNAKIIFFDPSLPLDSIEYLVNTFGEKIYLDPLSDEYAKKIKPFINRIYTLKPNKTELEVLSDTKINNEEDLEKACKIIIDKGVKKLYVTLGEKGALFYSKEKKIRKRFRPVENMVNASGAGDSFFATIIFGNIKKLDEEESLELAMAAGILTVKSSETISPELSFENLKKIVNEENNKI
jgi:pseudouridine kinase